MPTEAYPEGERGEVRYPHGLQLDIGVESDPFEDIGCQRLVGVVAEPALEVGEVEASVRSGVEVAKHKVSPRQSHTRSRAHSAVSDWPMAMAWRRAR